MASKGNNSSKYRKTSPLIPKSPTSPASSIASSYLSSSMGFGSTSKSAGRSTPTTPGSARNLPSFAIQSKSLQPYAYADSLASADFQKSKENVTVTVRFRPLK